MTMGLRATFDKEYNGIIEDLVTMSQKVEWAIERSLHSLVESDRHVAREVISGDQEVNDFRFKIEEACLALIATQQPAAKDLRSVIAVMHVVLELERMGDHAAGIAKTVLMMNADHKLKALKKIPKMAELSRKMLADSIEAFNRRDVAWARAIAEQDGEMDHMYRSVFERLVEIMARRPSSIPNATYLMWCAHNLERIADRVTNIAEQVIFMTTGDIGELNV